MSNSLIYNVNQKPPFWKNLAFAMQQVMAIITATMLVPLLADASGVYLSQSATLVGAGVGTIVYLLFTKFKSPVFLGSSFSFILPLITAVQYGYFGIFLGSIFAGVVYVILAIVIKFVGSNWINKIMPPVIIGPVVAIIGFNLAQSAIGNLTTVSGSYNYAAIAVGLLTFFVTIIISVKGSKKIKMFPFIIGILAGYVVAAILTLIGQAINVEYLKIIDFQVFCKVADFSNWLPNFTFVGMFTEGASKITSFGDVVSIFVAFMPIAVVSFAEHIADHKNISAVIGSDLFVNPGLHRTLLGDGVGTIFGSFVGGCPTTTYGESIGCVALSKNASTKTIFTASILCIIIAFFYPLVVFISSIPSCVIGGVCIALYGFISVSGLRMMGGVNLSNSKNLFIASSIFICGIGGLEIKIGSIVFTPLACALIVGIITNLMLKPWRKKAVIDEEPEILQEKETITNNEDPKQNLHTNSENEKKSEEILEKIMDSELKDQS